MRYSQFVNTSVLMSDIKSQLRDKEEILMKKSSKKSKNKFKLDILKCIKIIFSPNLFIECQIIFIGEDKQEMFKDTKYNSYNDLLIIVYEGKYYEAPVYMLSNCITPRRFSKIIKNIDNKNYIEVMSNIEYYILREINLEN